MPTAVSFPGVYIEEVPSGVHPIAAVATSIAAFVDSFPRGPLNSAVEVLGFADFERMQTEVEQGIYVLTRLPAQTRLYPNDGEDLPLTEQLAAWRKEGVKAVDMTAEVGNKNRLSGRLVALACPPDVVARRLNKGLRLTGVIICMYETGTRLAAEVCGDVRAYFSEQQADDSPWSSARALG